MAEAGHRRRVLAHGIPKSGEVRKQGLARHTASHGFHLRYVLAAEVQKCLDETGIDTVSENLKQTERAGSPVNLRRNMIAPRIADIKQR